MKDHFQTEDTLNNKEVEGSATENIKCLYLCTGYFAQPENFTTFFVIFGTNLDLSKPAKKITKQTHAILEPTQKVSAFYNQCAMRSDTPKLGVFNRGVATFN